MTWPEIQANVSWQPSRSWHFAGSGRQPTGSALYGGKRPVKPEAFTPTTLNLPGVRDETKKRVDSIFAERRRLVHLLSLHAEAVHKRWQKKSIEQRKKVLLTAWPSMPDTHRPDIHNWNEYEAPDKVPEARKDDFVWPHINSDDLSRPAPLLLMMYSRAKYSPDAFVSQDFDSMSLGMNSAVLLPGYLKGWTTLFLGQNTTKTYGQLRSWSQQPESKELMELGFGLPAGEAVLLLRLQETILRFLCRCIELILLPDVSLPKAQEASEEEMSKMLASLDHWQLKLVTTDPLQASLETPYRPPLELDFNRMTALLYAKHKESLEHLWYVREDPGYFYDGLLEYSEHQFEHLHDTNGRHHPELESPRFWTGMTFNFTLNACGDPFPWSLAKERLAHIVELHNKYGEEVAPGKCLPYDFEVAVCKLMDHHNRILYHISLILFMSLRPSPPLRSYYLRDADDDITDPQYPKKPPVKCYQKSIMLLWLLEQLQDKHAIDFYGLHNLLAYTHRIMLTSGKGRELVSPFVARLLSEMDLINQILRYFLVFRFRAPSTDIVDKVTLKAEYDSRCTTMHKCHEALWPELGNIFMFETHPLSTIIYPPDGIESNMETTSIKRQAEANLDAFWAKMDHAVVNNTGKGVLENLAPSLAGRTLKRTDPWIDPDIKNPPPPPPATPQHPHPHPHPPITVGKKALKTFTALFASTSVTPAAPPSSKILWSDFVNAMVNAGFKAERLAGSAWVFRKKDDEVKDRAIWLYEPHSRKDMPLDMMRRYGERLGREYGVEGGSFVRGGG
ncbi:MAG: hypothetical protein LQ338_008082 [Usnochroma carphineum]|nr:MAG: hypothetical protein LQ338_008082 [Usnochroma carphineum]